MNDIAQLVGAIADLLWPLVALVAVFVFKGDLAKLLGRIRRGKVLGQEFELDEELNELAASTDAAEAEASKQQGVEGATDTGDELSKKTRETPVEDQARRTLDEVQALLEEAASSPKVALMLLSAEIEARLRFLTAALPMEISPNQPVPILVKELQRRLGLPASVASSIDKFWRVRNAIVHGRRASEDEMLRALDNGLTIFRILGDIDLEVHTTYTGNVPLFEDPEASRARHGVTGVWIKTSTPDNLDHRLAVYPTTLQYKRDQRVGWAWNLKRIWGESWCRHPDTDQVVKAFDSSMEFQGRVLDENLGVRPHFPFH